MTTAAAVHILVIPYPAQGHLHPLLHLTDHLLLLSPSSPSPISITLLVTPLNLPLVPPHLLSHPSFSTLVLPFPPHPSIPAGIENTKGLPPNSFRPMITSLGKLYDPLKQWFNSHRSPPGVIVSDMFLGWTQRFAEEFRIKRVVFSPSGAFALSVIYSLWGNFPRKGEEDDGNGVVLFGEIPGCPKYPWWQLSQVFRSHVEGDVESEFIREGFNGNLRSWGLVINSFDRLESVYLGHLMGRLGHDRVWAVGPLLPPGEEDVVGLGGSASGEVNGLMTWLDGCGDQEVVYVCFGSQAVLTDEQMEALGLGLEKSKARFVWSIRVPPNGTTSSGMVPQGFEERVAGRGLLIRGWAPQVAILRHRAVGAFLTHCGWNSIIEGLVASVPMLAWPLSSDQFSNATLLVEVLRVAVRVCEGAKAVPDSDALARVFADAVKMGSDRRIRSEELKMAALEAIGEGGSSLKELDRMINDIVDLSD